MSRQLHENILVDKLICILSSVPVGNDDFAFHDRLLPVHRPESARAILSNALTFYVFLLSLLSTYRARDVTYIRREASDKIHSAYCISITSRDAEEK